MLTLLNSIPLNITLTVLIVLGLIATYILQKRFIKKRESTINKWLLILIYLALLLILGGSIIGIMAIWNFDFTNLFADFGANFGIFIEESLSAIIATAITIFIWALIIRISKITLVRIGDKPGALQRRRKTITKVTQSVITYAVAIIAIIVILAIWGVNVVPALAGLGIAGLILGLGAQKFIQDVIAGFFIIFEHHFDVGDVIEVDEFKGTVIDIGLKTTKIRNWKGDVRIFNNGEVTTLINYSKNPSVAAVTFTIGYKENINAVTELINNGLIEVRKKNKKVVLENPTVTGIMNFGQAGIELRVTAKTLNEQHYGIERELRAAIKDILDANHIDFALPQIVVNESKK